MGLRVRPDLPRLTYLLRSAYVPNCPCADCDLPGDASRSYGADSLGYSTGAEGAGFGVWDESWGPFTGAKKGFGIRQAHDYTDASCGGQRYSNGAIWAKVA